MNDSETIKTSNHALLVAAGSGSRSGLAVPKQFALLRGKPMVRYSAETFLDHPDISHLWIVIAADQEQAMEHALNGLSGFTLVTGGTTRFDSVRNGLDAVARSGGVDNILIHDAARPFLSAATINQLLLKLQSVSAAIPVLPTIDTTVKCAQGIVQEAVDRDQLWRVQTPQAFQFEKLRAAHAQWPNNKKATDDAQIFRASGHKVTTIEGDEILKKYTNAADFAEDSEKNMTETRTGLGYDVHQLVADEELWIGGLKIDYEKGLAGHSDADVLLHALTDALLGAVGAGDIGDHFPPSDPQWRGASSDKFVEFAASVIKQKGGRINNVDMTVICEAPKIKPHREAMRKNIADLLNINVDHVNVKATTTERLGFTGRKEGIAAQAVATITME